MSTGWEDRAESFIAWARRPEHDAYRQFRGFFFELLPPPGRAALEVGCGEGRVCRDLRARGFSVIGLDAAPSLVDAAWDADPEGSYVTGAAEELPFTVDGSYFEERSYELTAERDGLSFTFASRTYPLESYMRALEAAGLLVEAVREPVGFDDRDRRMPQFLLWRAVKR